MAKPIYVARTYTDGEFTGYAIKQRSTAHTLARVYFHLTGGDLDTTKALAFTVRDVVVTALTD